MDGLLARWTSAIAASPLTVWIGASVLVYAIGANALWLLRDSLRRPVARWLVQAGRFSFYLILPYLAWGGWPRRPYQGLLSLEDMGIVGLSEHWPVTRWLEAVGVGLGWSTLALAIMSLAWVSANRRHGSTWFLFSPSRWWAVLVGVLYLQVHWAFYRGALAVMLDDAYAGAVLGLGLVYLEWSLNPFWREGWRLASRAAERWLRASLVLVIALLFFLSRNLWVCLGVHLLIEFSMRQLGREQARRRLAPSPSQQAEALTQE
jgi:hypothetical protein